MILYSSHCIISVFHPKRLYIQETKLHALHQKNCETNIFKKTSYQNILIISKYLMNMVSNLQFTQDKHQKFSTSLHSSPILYTHFACSNPQSPNWFGCVPQQHHQDSTSKYGEVEWFLIPTIPWVDPHWNYKPCQLIQASLCLVRLLMSLNS